MNKIKLRDQIIEAINSEWPTHIKEIAENIGLDKERNSNITKIKYHVDNLEKTDIIRKKKIGKAAVVWPYHIEKLRVVHDLLKED